MKPLETLLNQWYKPLTPLLNTEYFKGVMKYISDSRDKGYEIIPNEDELFYNLRIVDPSDLKVVIIDVEVENDHSKWDGLLYSDCYLGVNTRMNNIRRELDISALNKCSFTIGNLEYVCKQGVLLLTVSNTAFQGKLNSCVELWKPFFKQLIKLINTKNDLVIVLQDKVKNVKPLLTNRSHCIISCPNFSTEAIVGSGIFKIINKELNARNKKEIEW